MDNTTMATGAGGAGAFAAIQQEVSAALEDAREDGRARARAYADRIGLLRGRANARRQEPPADGTRYFFVSMAAGRPTLLATVWTGCKSDMRRLSCGNLYPDWFAGYSALERVQEAL